MPVLRIPDNSEFSTIKIHVHEFELDDRELNPNEFTAAFFDSTLAGFGRLREYSNCTELCTLGIMEIHRNKGVAKKITRELILRAKNDLYLVCIIPDFFTAFGFSIVDEYPGNIKNKLDYCTANLVVPETYVVMKHTQNN